MDSGKKKARGSKGNTSTKSQKTKETIPSQLKKKPTSILFEDPDDTTDKRIKSFQSDDDEKYLDDFDPEPQSSIRIDANKKSKESSQSVSKKKKEPSESNVSTNKKKKVSSDSSGSANKKKKTSSDSSGSANNKKKTSSDSTGSSANQQDGGSGVSEDYSGHSGEDPDVSQIDYKTAEKQSPKNLKKVKSERDPNTSKSATRKRELFEATAGHMPDQPSWVYPFRDYQSEPIFTIPFEKKFTLKKRKKRDKYKKPTPIKEKCLSLEDLFMSQTGYPDLVTGTLSEIKLRAYSIDESMTTAWKNVFELEKKRFSFYDELFARGFVVDSMEKPRSEHKEAVEDYFIEADEKDFCNKIDYGRVVFKTKHVYTGNFLDWYFQGPGKYTWVDGTVYQGQFQHGLMHGQGTIHWVDGCLYEGEFRKGTRAGWGVYSTSEGFTYAGDWLNGVPHGQGKMWYDPELDDGDYYDGEWADGLQNGHGTRQYSTGDRYIGNWNQGQRSGHGTMIWLKERQVYKGEWTDGAPHGKGKHMWYLERTGSNAFPTRHVYYGDWFEGKRHGIGKMIYPCGSIYEGRWKDGQRHGKGVFLNPAGDIIMGLFKAGSIIGGSDVPLHAPTYEYDFGGLVEWLTAKFKLNTENELIEEENLSDITVRFLSQLRKLYKRAGQFGQTWGDAGLYPYWMKRSHPRHEHHIPNHEDNDEPIHMRGKTTKPPSPDGINPVTRFGLWLLIKDCAGLNDDVTLAYYDKIFGETPSISFQTRHNPFEPVYLWQFLQCLVIVAVAVNMEIPEQKIRLKLGDPPTPVETPRQSRNNTRESKAPTVAKPSAITVRNTVGSTLGDMNLQSIHENLEESNFGKITANSSGKLTVGDGNEKMTTPGDSSKPKKTMGEDLVPVVPLPPQTPLKPKTWAEVDLPEDDSLFGWDIPDSCKQTVRKRCSDIFKLPKPEPVVGGMNDDDDTDDENVLGEYIPYHKRPRSFNITISDAFETFLMEKMVPCLGRKAGINLPEVPTPLPPLRDLYDSFKSIKEKDSMTATEFMQITLPHLVHPKSKDAIFWHRSPEYLSNHVKMDDFFAFQKKKFGQFGGDKLSGEKDSDAISLNSEFLGSEVKLASGKLNDKVKKSEAEVNESELEKTEVEDVEDFVNDPLPFSEEDLTPEPFLWDDEPKCLHVDKHPRSYTNIKTHDVLNVLRFLYPKLVGHGSETNVNFEMIFCDWLWGVCLTAKISADREFRSAMQSEQQNELTYSSQRKHHPQSAPHGVYSHHFKRIRQNQFLRKAQEARLVQSAQSSTTVISITASVTSMNKSATPSRMDNSQRKELN